MFKKISTLIMLAAIGCSHQKPQVQNNSISNVGWITEAQDNWSFQYPPDFNKSLAPLSSDETKVLLNSEDKNVFVSFSVEDTGLDLDTYSSAYKNMMEEEGGSFLISKEGKLDNKDAILIVFGIPPEILSINAITLYKNKAYIFNCSVATDVENTEGKVCGQISKTIKIK